MTGSCSFIRSFVCIFSQQTDKARHQLTCTHARVCHQLDRQTELREGGRVWPTSTCYLSNLLPIEPANYFLAIFSNPAQAYTRTAVNVFWFYYLKNDDVLAVCMNEWPPDLNINRDGEEQIFVMTSIQTDELDLKTRKRNKLSILFLIV